AGHAVEALVGAELDVAVVVDALQELLHRPVVARLAGADEVVVGDGELRPRVAEPLGGDVGPLLGRHAPRLGRALHLQAVLVGAGQEERLVTEQAVPAGHRVGDDRRVGVADVGGVVDVVDRGRHVEAGHGLRLLPVATVPITSSTAGAGPVHQPSGAVGHTVVDGQPRRGGG